MDDDTEHKDQILLTESERDHIREIYTEENMRILMRAVTEDYVHPEAARDVVLMASQARVGDILCGIMVEASNGQRYMISYYHAHHHEEGMEDGPEDDERSEGSASTVVPGVSDDDF